LTRKVESGVYCNVFVRRFMLKSKLTRGFKASDLMGTNKIHIGNSR
jgi:hypothetical protein